MYFCRTKKHVWRNKTDADKCCNGYHRIVVSGKDIPADATNIQTEKDTGIRLGRVWVKQ